MGQMTGAWVRTLHHFFFYILLIFIVCFNKDDKQRITLTIMCIFTILYKKKHEKTKQKDKQGEDK